MIFIMVCRELWEIGVFVLSQWTKVIIICHYIRLQQRPGWIPRLQRLMTEKLARIMFWIITRGQWDENIQQYNLLMVTAPLKATKNGRFFRSRCVKLESKVKRTIFESLKRLLKTAPGKDSPSSSAHTRSSNTLISHHKSAFADAKDELRHFIENDIDESLKGDTHKILVWHVATSLCQIKLLQEAGSQGDLYTLQTPAFADPGLAAGYITAVSLSNYCAYLVTQGLVPDTGLVARTVFVRVRRETRQALARCGTLAEIRRETRMAAAHVQTEDPSIVELGAMLAERLMSNFANDGDLWERLGRFWSGFLLHLSASTTVAKHRIHLQGKGELTTHLWVFLSHAGFLGKTAHGEQLLDPVDLNDA
ncbi:hypothetical protein ACQ4PT_037299 [Festuca glaucescens]